MKEENKNFIYNVIYQLFLYIIPLILTPYISRILGVNNVGIYSYLYSIVYYFMLFTLLGINNYGSRSIAKVSNDKEQLSKMFFSIYGLQVFLGMIMLIIYNIIIYVFLKEYEFIPFINNLFLISAIFDINWFYFGLEKFKITVSRNFIIKIISLICVFVFVKKREDLWIYTVIMSLSVLISQLYLFLFLNKYVKKCKLMIKDCFIHFKSCLILFIPVLAYSIYRVMDKTMIGFFAGTLELGYYENAEKIINIPISFITALGTVMLPHISKLSKDNNFNLIKEKIYKSFELCMFFVIPMVIGLILIGPDFALCFLGEEFEKSGYIISILAITILFSGIANVVRTNYLIPFEKDKIYVTSTIFGALINFVCNVIFIKKYGAYGACIGTILAEFVVMLYQVIKVRKKFEYRLMLKTIKKYIICSSTFIVIFFIIKKYVEVLLLRVVLIIFMSSLTYIILNKKFIMTNFFARGNR